jgi:hypothetical protein
MMTGRFFAQYLLYHSFIGWLAMIRKAAEASGRILLYLSLTIFCFCYLLYSCNPVALCSNKCPYESEFKALMQASFGRHDTVLEVLVSKEEQIIQMMSSLLPYFPEVSLYYTPLSFSLQAC